MTSSPAAALPSSGPKAGSSGSRRPAFDLKGTMASLTVLRLRSTDLVLIERQLRVKIAQLPHLFLDAPVLIDLGALAEGAAALAFGDLVGALKSCKLVPVAVANVPDGLRTAVTAAGLGVWRPPTAPGRARGDGDSPEAPPAEASAAESATTVAPPSEAAPAVSAMPALSRSPQSHHGGPMVVTQAVRGGQIVYAQNNDLVVLAPVNSGAQVIADGHVHIYAPLRGRAVAGAQGLAGARIFCQKLEAELVAISGAYIMAEEIPAKMRGKAVQIFLENGECQIAPL